MLAIEEWAIGRFKPMAMLAQVMAVSVPECFGLMQEARRGWPLSREEAVGIQPSAWLRCYRRPMNLEAAALQFVFSPTAALDVPEVVEVWPLLRQEVGQAIASAMRQWLMEGISRKRLEQGHRYWERLYKWVHLPMLRRMLCEDEPPPPNFTQWLGQSEFVFLLSVAMPCWLEFQQTPWGLFQDALSGDFAALEKLLRLDPEVDKDEELKVVVFRLRGRSPEQYKLLQQARLEGQRCAITLADVKFRIGGLMMKWSQEWEGVLRGELLFQVLEEHTPTEKQAQLKQWTKAIRKMAARESIKCWVKGPDVRSLFDAIARDTNQGWKDPDFAGQPNSNYKRLKRNADLWPGLREVDIFRAA